MKRQEFLRKTATGAAGAFFARTIASAQTGKGSNPNRPNIIFIMADDLGYHDLGCYGQTEIQTPHIDRLAAEGTRFTDCYAGSTVCAPSRSVLMTGLHTGHTRVRGNFAKVGGVPPQGRVPLEPEDLTVAEVMKQAGYATGITGKWGLGEPETTGPPTRQGFDEWFGYLNQRNAHSYYPPYLWRNEEKIEYPGNRDGGREVYSHDLMADFALEFIEKYADEPFFLYLPFTIPHAKYEIPDLGAYADKPWSKNARVHAAMITRMDKDIGRLMSLLREKKIDERTLVFFCSDNGAAQRWDGIFDSSHPLRGRKRDMYEGGLRTPMIARWPGKVPTGKFRSEPWWFADLLPTLADLTGQKIPDGLDGVSVKPLLLGKEQNTSDRYFYWEFYEAGHIQQAVRHRNWKVVRLHPEKPLELYDLSKDIAETTDISAEHPRVIKMFEDYLKTCRTDSPNWPLRLLMGREKNDPV